MVTVWWYQRLPRNHSPYAAELLSYSIQEHLAVLASGLICLGTSDAFTVVNFGHCIQNKACLDVTVQMFFHDLWKWNVDNERCEGICPMLSSACSSSIK